MSPVNFVCVWTGEKYGRDYVDIWADMVIRNASNLDEFRLWALTDRPSEVPEGITAIEAPAWTPGWWAKCALFSPDMPWGEGERVVYTDLDIAVTGRLEDLAERDGIIQDWFWPCKNSSVMSWLHGDHSEIWTTLTPKRLSRKASAKLAPLLPKGEVNGGDQEHISEVSTWDTFPTEWFRSYREAKAWPPTHCKAVIFHGLPKPAEIQDGWVPNVWARGGLTSLPEFKGVNTSEDMRLEHVRLSVQRDLEWFSGFKDEGKSCVIVCGAPSMKDHISDIRWWSRQKKTRIVTVNNAWRYLVANGVTPDVHVMLDARPENAEFLRGAPKSMRILLASQCHPDVFDLAEAEGLQVVEWHNGYDRGNEKLQEILAPWWDGPNQKPCILVPGGSTVGLRSLWLAAYSGFRKIHMYGIDSSYAENGMHHAYAQSLNDQEAVLEVVRGEKKYRCAPWMIRQAAEFAETWNDLRNHTEYDGTPAPVTVHVHGRGLIPDIARDLRDEERAA